MKNYLDGGEAVVQAFRSLDIDYVMASPGSEWGAVWEALARQKVSNSKGPTYLSCAHETLAVDLAIGYTGYTGRIQAVMLHTGVGLLQGSMGVNAAQKQGLPMVVVSGEALTYGEQDGFDPGPQWQASLSVVGGPQRLAEPLVKWSTQASSTETLYQQIVSAGEMAQRSPAGPIFMCVPIETTLREWAPPDDLRMAPTAPRLTPAAADIERVAGMLAEAAHPVIMTEGAGRRPEGYDAMVALAELLSIPVVEGDWSYYANFPKDHDLHQGFGRPDFLDEADLILTVGSRAPWYPASNRPAKATIVAVDETPFRPDMVYHNAHADIFLEGDMVASLELLAEAVSAAGVDASAVEKRAKRWAKAHAKLWDDYRAAEAEASAKRPVHALAMWAAMGKALPDDAIYVNETITHSRSMVRHLENRGPRSYFRAQGGLGQGLGVALGVKLAARDRPVVAVLGDGSFMYNPITQSLALSKHEDLPILIVVLNNDGYLAMKREHQSFYPDGVAAANDLFYGSPITGLDYAELVAPFGGYGRRVDDPAALPEALGEALAAVADGRTAILNVQVDP